MCLFFVCLFGGLVGWCVDWVVTCLVVCLCAAHLFISVGTLCNYVMQGMSCHAFQKWENDVVEGTSCNLLEFLWKRHNKIMYLDGSVELPFGRCKTNQQTNKETKQTKPKQRRIKLSTQTCNAKMPQRKKENMIHESGQCVKAVVLGF